MVNDDRWTRNVEHRTRNTEPGTLNTERGTFNVERFIRDMEIARPNGKKFILNHKTYNKPPYIRIIPKRELIFKPEQDPTHQ